VERLPSNELASMPIAVSVNGDLGKSNASWIIEAYGHVGERKLLWRE